MFAGVFQTLLGQLFSGYRFQLSPVHDQRSAAGIFQTFLATYSYSEDSF